MHVKSHAQELTHVSTKPKATKENMYIMTVQKELLRRNTLQQSPYLGKLPNLSSPEKGHLETRLSSHAAKISTTMLGRSPAFSLHQALASLEVSWRNLPRRQVGSNISSNHVFATHVKSYKAVQANVDSHCVTQGEVLSVPWSH